MNTVLYSMGYYLSTFVLIVAFWHAARWYDYYEKCSTKHIVETCDSYLESNSTYNDFCSRLCKKDNLIIEHCFWGSCLNKTVFQATLQGKKVVVKVDKLWFQNMAELDSQSETLLNPDNYLSKIVDHYFGKDCNNCRELVSELLKMADTNSDGVVSLTESKQFGSLLMSRDVFMLAVLNQTKTTVQLYGYCGPIYVTEIVVPLRERILDTSDAFSDFWSAPEVLDPLEAFLKDFLRDMRESSHTFLELHETIYIWYNRLMGYQLPTLVHRIDMVIGLTRLVYDQATLKYGELIQCDISFDNAGFSNLSEFSVVKQTDLDEVFAAAKVSQEAIDKKCWSDEDCEDVFTEVRFHKECTSFCQNNGFCSKKMKQDNLTHLCKGIFVYIFFNRVILALSNETFSQDAKWLYVETLTECQDFSYSTLEKYLLHVKRIMNMFQQVKQLIQTNS